MVVEGLKSRQPTEGVFLDLLKAFDRVDHEALLDKLNSHGVLGIPLFWLMSYLNERSQVIHIANKFSDSTKLSYGVSKGSILSPALFLVYVKDTASLRKTRAVR